MFAQMPTEPPDSLLTFQWIVIVALISALIYVFKAWQNDRKESQNQQTELLEKSLTALSDVKEVLQELTVAFEGMKSQYETFQAIQDVLRRLDGHEKDN